MESVTRHRGGGRDEDGKIIPATAATLMARKVAPGVSSRWSARDHEGLAVALTVYFTSPVDLVNSDELTVRGNRYQIVVNEWHIGRGLLEVLCTRGEA